MSAAGAILFARYAYPPNELGYCGPVGAETLLDARAHADIEARARAFEGAWSYLELLAEVTGDPDPLSEQVVEAYWVGSDLLDAVEPDVLVGRLERRFAGQLGGSWRNARGRARAHHSFQVFEVYPWVGILTRGATAGPAVNVLDRCRIRTGAVASVEGESALVTTATLRWQDGALVHGDPVNERVRWSVDGRSLIDPPAVGDQVALHWDWVCETITPDQGRWIEGAERRQLAVLGLAGSTGE
ncbi:MAG: DUF6390 family protein [Nocardioides sp.]